MGMMKWKANRVSAAAVLAVCVCVAGSAWGQLPGLPASAGAAADANADGPASSGAGGANGMANLGQGGVRPGENRPSQGVNPGMPVRGSLLKQSLEQPQPGYMPAAMAGTAGPGGGGVVRGSQSINLIAVTPPEPKRYHKNDILTVVISEESDSQINGSSNSKKTQDFDLAIKQFIQLALANSGIPTMGTVNNPSSLPEIKFNYSNDRQANAAQQRSDSLTARVTATVVDVKPNGTMVIEAVKQIVVDKEVQIFKLSGICRVEDITPDNTIVSTQLANLAVSKQTSGEVRDGTKRGWLNGFIDKISPF